MLIIPLVLPIARYRKQLGLSQARLAAEAEISLLTVQKIEAGAANPTWGVLGRIAKVLGIEIAWVPSPPLPDEGIEFGLPLSSGKADVGDPGVATTRERFVNFCRTVLSAWENLGPGWGERERQAFAATLLAVREHYPEFYRRRLNSPIGEKAIKEYFSEGKLLKLKRIALAHVSVFL